MALKTYTADNIEKEAFTCLLYAKPGDGKTTTIGKLPGKTVVLDIDKTSGVLKNSPNAKGILIIDIDVDDIVNSMNEALSWLAGNKEKYDNIAIDNVSELQSCILSYYGQLGRNDGVPSQGDYQKFQFGLARIIRNLKTLQKRILLTAWQELVDVISPTGEQYTSFMPRIQKSARDNVCGLCDVVGHLEITSTGERVIRLLSTKNVYAKNQHDDRKACRQEDLFSTGGNK